MRERLLASEHALQPTSLGLDCTAFTATSVFRCDIAQNLLDVGATARP